MFNAAHFIVLSLAAILALPATARPVQDGTQDPAAKQQQVAEDVWTEDAAEASARAKSEGKDLLLLFTGSDWCPPCLALEKDVLSTEEFKTEVEKNYVLLKIDFPQSIQQSETLIEQNKQWATRFGITGYPTIALLDSALRPYGFTGARPGPPADYLAHLDEFRQARIRRDEFLQRAEGAEGLEKAAMLDQALAQLDPAVAELYYEDVVRQIVELDADDQAGLRTKYFAQQDAEMRKALMSDISMVARLRPAREAIEFIDRSLEQVKLPAAMKLQAMRFKLELLRQLDSHGEADELMDEMISIDGLDPDTRQRLIVKKAFLMISSGETDRGMALLNQSISSSAENLILLMAKGELLDSLGDFSQAIAAYDRAITAAAPQPDLLVELIGAKADALCELGHHDQAIVVLESFADNVNLPPDLRAECLLHKSMILREQGRRRAAIIAENQAVEIVETPREKGEIQKLVEQLRNKFD